MKLRQRLQKYCVYYPLVAVQAGNLRAAQRSLHASQSWSRAELQALQLQRLQALVKHASVYVPRFREKLGSQAASPLDGLEDLARLPTLSKDEIQNTAAACRSQAALGKLVTKTTGGSTGEPVTVVKTKRAWLQDVAMMWRGYSWAGLDIGDPQARFWGVPLKGSGRWRARLIDLVSHRYRCSAFAFDDGALAHYVRALHRFRPAYFYGYVSMLAEFADYVARHRAAWRLKLTCIVTTSEVLTEPVRERLTSVFDAPVFNEYGCGELGSIAHECERGSLHLSEENMLAEILDGDRVCEPGEVGEIVVTELHNFAMPLIRYRTGDFGALASKPCRCGRGLAVLEGLHGRAYDMVRTRRGQSFHGEFMIYIFEDIKRRQPGIKQFQVVQRSIDSFMVRVVPQNGYDASLEEEITRQIRRHIDPAAAVAFERVPVIEREASGKMRVIVGLEP